METTIELPAATQHGSYLEVAAAFEFLTAEDRDLLLRNGDTVACGEGEVIVCEGNGERTLYVILEGSCIAVRSHRGAPVTVANLVQGEYFGAVSFLQRVAANASVIANRPTRVLRIPAETIDALLQSAPDLKARFYRSLATRLARRVQAMTESLPLLLEEGAAKVPTSRDEATGLAGHDALPPSLIADVGAFKGAMVAIEQRLIRGKGEREATQCEVSDACQALQESLNGHLDRETLSAKAIADYVSRETFPYFMASRLVERAYRKPRGYSGDYQTIEIIYENAAEGSGRLGPFIDRWVMDGLSCDAVRNRRGMMTALIRRVESQWRSHGPMPVCSLASGPAREICDLFVADPATNLHATCIDIDGEAIGYAGDLALDLGIGSRITFAIDNVIRLAAGRGRVRVGPQQLIYSTGLIDYLEDSFAISLLDWAHDTLLPGGKVAFGNFATGNPDKAFLDHVLEWVLIYRTADDLRELFARSKFGHAPVEVLVDPTGVQLLAVAQKA